MITALKDSLLLLSFPKIVIHKNQKIKKKKKKSFQSLMFKLKMSSTDITYTFKLQWWSFEFHVILQYFL